MDSENYMPSQLDLAYLFSYNLWLGLVEIPAARSAMYLGSSLVLSTIIISLW